LDDAYFTKTAPKVARSAEEEFFEDGQPKPKDPLPESRVGDQKAIDNALLSSIKKTDNLSKYLKASWGLMNGQFPHQLVFYAVHQINFF
jgi:large subunit ribosomal protein L6e